jgi:hypothetical protein
MMIERSRGVRGGQYDIAINPSRQEWAINFPEGAAGVYMQDGTLVVGNGPALDHISLVQMASLEPDHEKYRLQIMDAIYVELWEEGLGEDDYGDRAETGEAIGTPAWIEQHTRYKKAMRQQIANELMSSPNVKRLGLRVGIMIEDSLGLPNSNSNIWLKEVY